MYAYGKNIINTLEVPVSTNYLEGGGSKSCLCIAHCLEKKLK